MGWLGRLAGRADPPPAENPMTATLFGDMPIDRLLAAPVSQHRSPLDTFAEAQAALASGRVEAARAAWRRIADDATLDSRWTAQAWHFLRQNGRAPPPDVAKRLLGVVAEVTMAQGVDLIAAYRDRTARYWNFSGAGVVWVHADRSLDPLLDDLFDVSQRLVDLIGPAPVRRTLAPPVGHVRLSFLTPSGLHFGEGPMDLMQTEPLAGIVLDRVTRLMLALMEKSRHG